MCAFSPGPLHLQDEIGERIQREGSSLHVIGRALHQKPALMIPLSLTSDLQNPEKMNLCYFNSMVPYYLSTSALTH